VHQYSEPVNRVPLLGLIAVVALLVSISTSTIFDKLGIGPPWLFSSPALAASFGILCKLTDTRIWRWRTLRRMGLIDVPVVDGKYFGNLVSSYRKVEIPISVEIDQTWTRISIRLEVLEPKSSRSTSITAAVFPIGRQASGVNYSYKSMVQPGIIGLQLGDHDGTADVTINHITGEMTGRYYNFRGRRGTLTLIRE